MTTSIIAILYAGIHAAARLQLCTCVVRRALTHSTSHNALTLLHAHVQTDVPWRDRQRSVATSERLRNVLVSASTANFKLKLHVTSPA
jgi:hypothetical protein